MAEVAVSGPALYERRRREMLLKGVRLREWSELPQDLKRIWIERAAALTPEQLRDLLA